MDLKITSYQRNVQWTMKDLTEQIFEYHLLL